MIRLRDANLDDTAKIVALNGDVVAVTSPMDEERFAHLMDICDYCVVAELDSIVVGFVIAMTETSHYENENFSWFRGRLNKFVYIDRIVISETGRGQGLGGKLYSHVAEAAKTEGSLVMAAEMDLEPPNVGSLNFHEKRGFHELGSRRLNSGKFVSMQIRGL